MACGCKGGKWSPPQSESTGLTAAAKREPGAPRGPQAPGYFATYNGPSPKQSG